MHYKFRYEEIYARYVDVEADNGKDAWKRFEEAICNDEIVIDKNLDFCDSTKDCCGELPNKFNDCDDYISAKPSVLEKKLAESKKAEGEVIDAIHGFVNGFCGASR